MFEKEPLEGALAFLIKNTQMDFAELSHFSKIIFDNQCQPEAIFALCESQPWFSKVSSLFENRRLHPAIIRSFVDQYVFINGVKPTEQSKPDSALPTLTAAKEVPDLEGIKYDTQQYLSLSPEQQPLFISQLLLAAEVYSAVLEGRLQSYIDNELIVLSSDTVSIPLIKKTLHIQRTNGVLSVYFDPTSRFAYQDLVDSITVLTSVKNHITFFTPVSSE